MLQPSGLKSKKNERLEKLSRTHRSHLRASARIMMRASPAIIFMPNGYAARSFAAWPRGWCSAACSVPHRGLETLPDAILGGNEGRPRMRVHPSLPPRPPPSFGRLLRWTGGCLGDGFGRGFQAGRKLSPVL